MIRDFTPDDMQQVVKLLDELHDRTSYRMIRPDWPQIVRTITACSAKLAGTVIVAEHAGKITGVLIAVAQTLWWQDEKHGARVASDLIFYSKYPGDGRRMLRRMIDWAFSVPRVVRVECAVSSGEDPARLEPVYTGAGLTKDGSFFVANHPKYEAALSGRKDAA